MSARAKALSEQERANVFLAKRIVRLEEDVLRMAESLRQWQQAVYDTNADAQKINNRFVCETERIVSGFAADMEGRLEELERRVDFLVALGGHEVVLCAAEAPKSSIEIIGPPEQSRE